MYWYTGDYEVGDIVKVDGTKAGKLGRVVETADNAQINGLYQIIEHIAYVDDFAINDVENIWKSYKPAVRKEHLKEIGFDPEMNKKKIMSTVDYLWTECSAKHGNHWEDFLNTIK